MRERQYSFLFRGNRPSTPIAGNTAHDFARSCRKLDLSELVFGTFLAEIILDSTFPTEAEACRIGSKRAHADAQFSVGFFAISGVARPAP